MQSRQYDQCEICGKEIKKALKIKIGSSMMQVCSECSKFGEVYGHRNEVYAHRKFAGTLGKPRKRTRTAAKKMPEEGKELILAENYGKIIKNAREKLNLSQEKLAKMLSEKESVISRIEAQHMKPSERLAKKLEKALKIKILEEI